MVRPAAEAGNACLLLAVDIKGASLNPSPLSSATLTLAALFVLSSSQTIPE